MKLDQEILYAVHSASDEKNESIGEVAIRIAKGHEIKKKITISSGMRVYTEEEQYNLYLANQYDLRKEIRDEDEEE